MVLFINFSVENIKIIMRYELSRFIIYFYKNVVRIVNEFK